ncbi:hypothetical protein NC651_028196 [Populus alba x Populus x berolinensis]|nr:hypothetical protein NC651_028196 [Populus alba x Populus x berolinensis]
MAVLKDPPSNVTESSQDAGHHAANSNPFNSKELVVKVQDLRVASTSTTGHGESVVQKTHDQVKRRQGDARAATEREKCHASERMDKLFKRRRHEETGVCNYEAGSEGFGVHNSTNGPNLQWCNFGGKIASTSTVGHAKSVVQKTHDQLKREQEDAQAATEWEKRHASKRVGNSALRADQLFKRRRRDETGMNNHEADVLNQAVIGNGGAGIRNSSEPKRGQFEAQRVHGFSDIHTKSITGRELSLLELRNILMKKGLLEVRGKLKEWSSNQLSSLVVKLFPRLGTEKQPGDPKNKVL